MPDAVFSGATLYAWIKDLVDGRGREAERPDLFAAELVRLMKTTRPPWNKKKLILRAFDRLERRRADAGGRPAALPEKKKEKPPAQPKSASAVGKAWRLLLAGLDAQFRRSQRVPCRSRYDGEILSVSLGNKCFPLLPVSKNSGCSAYYAQTPNFYICIRGEIRMSDSEQRRLRIYLEMLAQRDAILKTLLCSAQAPPYARAKIFSNREGPMRQAQE